jgi:hypothetical protein
MGEEHFDVDAALKDGIPPAEIAAHLAQLHGVDRDSYLKDGLTDEDFLNEYRGKALPQTTTPAEPAAAEPAVSSADQPSNAANAMFGTTAAIAGAIPGGAHASIKAAMRALGKEVAQPVVAPTVAAPNFASPSEVSQRVMQSGVAPRPEGPSDVVNWAMGKGEGSGQYSRGYLGGTSQEHEAALHKQADALEAANPGYKIKPGTSSVLIPESEYHKLVSEAKATEKAAADALHSKAKMAAELRAKRLAQVNPANLPLSVKTANAAQELGNRRSVKNFLTGYNASDLLQAQNPFEATVSAVGTAAPYSAGLIEKALPAKYKPVAKLLGPAVGAAAPAINWLERKIIGPKEPEPEQHAGGGLIGGYAGGKAVKGALEFLFQPKATKIVKASEAFAPHEGKWLNVTQSDRMRSTNGDLGGPGFSKFQNEVPAYAEAKAAWGVGQKPTASGIVNVNKRFPEGQAIWTPMIGSETQHHSNQHVYDMLTDEFNRQASMGKLPSELRARVNKRLAESPETKGMFPAEFDIANPEHLKTYGDTFNRRGAISTVLSGQGVGGTKGRIIDYPGIMQEMTDPMTIGAPTHALGTRLFTLNNEVMHRPDLHSAFPYILGGTDQGVSFNAVPKELGLPDFINQFKEFKGREPGYYDLVRTTPSQQITEKYLRSLQDAGHAAGGKIGALEALAKKFLPAAEKSVSAAERNANLAKYMEQSAVKEPMYHGTSHDIREFKPGVADTIFVTRSPFFAGDFARNSENLQAFKLVKDTPSEEMAKILKGAIYGSNAGVQRVQDVLPSRANIMQVHVNAKNPFDYENPEHVDAVINELNKMTDPWGMPRGRHMEGIIRGGDWEDLERPHVQTAIKNLGHDAYWVKEGPEKNLGVYDPRQLKSTTGNIGTFDPMNPDISHAQGGLVDTFKEGGHATPAWQRSEGKNPEGGLNAVGRASYNREHGAHLKAPQPEGGSRKDSFCARMEGMRKKLTSSETANDPDSRINKSLRKWKC